MADNTTISDVNTNGTIITADGKEIPTPPWACDMPEGSYITTAPTFRVGEYFDLYHEDIYGTFSDEDKPNYSSLKYYFYDPTEHGYPKGKNYPLLIHLHGTSNALVDSTCINYSGAELYASPAYQADIRGAYILVPLANEYRENDSVKGENLTNIRDSIINYKKNKRRKIAIFTDLHGLFEPGLAILEDARKKGITEIYSLGDNIGTGPNPKEVIQLLKEYGVKSVKGNHEGYAIDLAKYEQHLISTGAWNEAEANSEYTRAQLSEEEMAYIESLPEDYTIEIGGKKILLTHYIKDYNTETSRYDLANYDDIYQGHVHFGETSRYDLANYDDIFQWNVNFGETSSNLTTLKGAAIGNNPDTKIEKNNLTASYIIITETENGYEVESVSVPYNFKETHFDIQTS